jgi:hypothetical protein
MARGVAALNVAKKIRIRNSGKGIEIANFQA